MKRILINATQNEEIRVALCKGNHLYDFDLENRTREQKKSNIYKAHVTRVEPSLEAVFVEYGSQRQGFLPIREISSEYLSGNPRDENIKKLIKEGDELIVQVEKEERGNKGAALSTYVSLAGRYLVLMPNNPRGGGISRQISGKLREDMKRMLGNLDLPKGMSVIIRTAGIGKTQEDLQHDLNHLLNIWQAILEQNKKFPSPRLVHQEAGVVTRAVRDYLRDDISEIWIDNENAYLEAANFIDAVMPKQADKLRKYTDFEPMFARFNIEKQIETAYQREVRLPSGGSIVIDQTEALVSIDINSAKSTKGSDVAETAYHTNLEAADEIARQLRLRDMGGLIVIDFIDMNDSRHQKEVEKRLVEATKYDRARVQFGEISKFGLMEMSRQRLRPSLEESTGYICPRCHGNGMIRDLRSLSLSIMRQIEQIALKERQGEVQAEVPTDIAAFLLNEKRDSLVYLEQDSGTRITILPHAHLESPNFKLHFNRDGFAPTSYERISDTQQQEFSDLGYDVDWQTAESARPEQQPTRQPRNPANTQSPSGQNAQNQSATQNAPRQAQPATSQAVNNQVPNAEAANSRATNSQVANSQTATAAQNVMANNAAQKPVTTKPETPAVAWLSNLFAQAPQAATQASVSSNDAASAIETLVNSGAQSLGAFGQVDAQALQSAQPEVSTQAPTNAQNAPSTAQSQSSVNDSDESSDEDDRRKRKPRKTRTSKPRARRDSREDDRQNSGQNASQNDNQDRPRQESAEKLVKNDQAAAEEPLAKRKPMSQRSSRGKLDREKPITATQDQAAQDSDNAAKKAEAKDHKSAKSQNFNEVVLQINEAPAKLKAPEVVHLTLDEQKPAAKNAKSAPKASSKASSEADQSDNSESESKKVAAPVSKSAAVSNAASESKANEADKADNIVKADKVEDTKARQSTEATKASQTPDQGDRPADYSGLFSDRYVTAHKFGKAVNDPRTVRQNLMAKAQEKAPEVTATDSKRQALQGSVGEFIRANLPDASAKLSEIGVIRSFIEAMAAISSASATSARPELEASAFDFSNYGYAPLSAQYQTAFATMITPVAQFAAHPGKTPVTPSAIGKRASNDPRGQHPDFASAQEVGGLNQEGSFLESASLESNALENSRLDQQNSAKASDNPSEPAISAVKNDDHVATEPSPEVDAHEVAATALSPESQAVDVSIDSENLLKADADQQQKHDQDSQQENQQDSQETADPQDASYQSRATGAADEATKEDSQSAKSKTTIASYKNMIENVAEQLLPQTGMFNLTTPKVPKARSRKPKTEHKKPTQAEKSALDDDQTSS